MTVNASFLFYQIGGAIAGISTVGLGLRGFWIVSQNDYWTNKIVMSYTELLTIKDHYSTKYLDGKHEFLVHISKEELDKMSSAEKTDFFKRFDFTSIEKNGYGHKAFVKAHNTFLSCVEKSTGFYVGCVPNINNGTFEVKNVGEVLSDLVHEKTERKYHKLMMYGICSWVTLGITYWMVETSKMYKE